MATGTALDLTYEADRLAAGEISRGYVFGTPDNTTVRNLVTTGWAGAQQYAAAAFTAANNYLTSLQGAATGLASIPNVDTTLTMLATGLSAITPFTETFGALAVDVPFSDVDYTSTEFNQLITTLATWVMGSPATGIEPTVEQQLWDRGRSREAAASQKKIGEAYRQFAARGFTKPPGALALTVAEAVQSQQDNDVTFSREVTVKQADLEQSNRRFAFEAMSKLQETLIQYLTSKQARALDKQKTIMQLKVEVDSHMEQAYAARAGFQGSLVGANASIQRALADVEIAEGNLRVEAAKANIQALIQKATLLVESIRAAAQIQGQLAAAALSAVNLSAGLHDTEGWNMSVSDARSRSTSVSVSGSGSRGENYQYTP